MTHPLCDGNMINARLDAVSEILESMGTPKASQNSSFPEGKSGSPEIHHIISSVLITLAKSPDVQRGITRIFHGTSTASEVTN